MFPKVELIEVVGKYAGPVGVTLLLLVAVLFAVLRIPGEPKAKEKRINFVLWLAGIFGVLALGLIPIMKQMGSGCNSSVVGSTTSGKLSPIVPCNSGSISITDDSKTTEKKGSSEKKDVDKRN